MKKLLTIIFISIIAVSCEKDNVEIIPNIRFNAEIYLDNPQYSGKNPFIIRPGGLNPRVGVNGVVVYKISMTEYYAFDLMCTHEHENPGLYFVDITKDGGPMVTCPECQSEFLISTPNGAIISGPAKWALKPYQTSVSNNILRIWN